MKYMSTWIIVAIYLAPLAIAAIRRQHNVLAVAVLNLFLGWTVIGWIAALVGAFLKPHRTEAPQENATN